MKLDLPDFPEAGPVTRLIGMPATVGEGERETSEFVQWADPNVFEVLPYPGAALVVISMVMIRPRCTPIPRSVVVTWCVLGVAYVAYMFLVDVPMYWERWVADQAAGREYFTILQAWPMRLIGAS